MFWNWLILKLFRDCVFSGILEERHQYPQCLGVPESRGTHLFIWSYRAGQLNTELFGYIDRIRDGLGEGQGFLVVLVVKNSPASAENIRDMGSIPGWKRSPVGGHDNPLQYSCLENPMDRGPWWATVYRVAKSRTWLKRVRMHTQRWGSILGLVQDLSEETCFIFCWFGAIRL